MRFSRIRAYLRGLDISFLFEEGVLFISVGSSMNHSSLYRLLIHRFINLDVIFE